MWSIPKGGASPELEYWNSGETEREGSLSGWARTMPGGIHVAGVTLDRTYRWCRAIERLLASVQVLWS